MENKIKSRRVLLPSLEKLGIYRKNIIERRFEAKIILCPSRFSPVDADQIDFVKRTPSPPRTKKKLSGISAESSINHLLPVKKLNEVGTGNSVNQPLSSNDMFSRKFSREAYESPARVISFYSYKKKNLKLQPKKISSVNLVKKEVQSMNVSPKFTSPKTKYSDFSCQIDL